MNRFRRATARGDAVPAFPYLAGREDHRLRVAGALFAVGALLALWVVAGLSLGSAPAQATFPGENGRIACEGDRRPQPDPSPGNFAPTEIFTVNPDGSDERVLTSNLVTDGDPAFSPDGQKIAFNSTRDGDSEIYTMNVDGTEVRRLTTSPGTDRQPTWSPDGSRIVFHSGRDRHPDGSINFEVYVMNADGSGQSNLTNSPAQDAVPSWSPDGTRIAFQGLRAGNLEIHTMNADGTDVRNLTNNSGAPGAPNTSEDISPNWSPDSRQIVFASGRDSTRAGFVNYEIYRMNAADGSGLTRLTSNPASGPDTTDFDNFPNFSPDGTRIVFNSGREGLGALSVHVFTMNAADGSDVRRVARQAGDNRSACDWDRTVRVASIPSARDSRAPAVRAARACASGRLRARVRVDEPVQSVVVSLNGRRLLRTRRASFTVRVPARRLRRGRVNRLTVVATDAAGNRTRRAFRLRACRAQRRPRFTG